MMELCILIKWIWTVFMWFYFKSLNSKCIYIAAKIIPINELVRQLENGIIINLQKLYLFMWYAIILPRVNFNQYIQFKHL